MTAMVFSDLSLRSRIVLSSCGELLSIGSTSVDATSPFSRSVASVMTGGAGNKERGNSEHGTRNLDRAGSVLTVWSSFQLMFRPTNSGKLQRRRALPN
jgi:hypothetical protein